MVMIVIKLVILVMWNGFALKHIVITVQSRESRVHVIQFDWIQQHIVQREITQYAGQAPLQDNQNLGFRGAGVSSYHKRKNLVTCFSICQKLFLLICQKAYIMPWNLKNNIFMCQNSLSICHNKLINELIRYSCLTENFLHPFMSTSDWLVCNPILKTFIKWSNEDWPVPTSFANDPHMWES